MFREIYTQCQCCGDWYQNDSFLCKDCIKDSKNSEHEKELIKVLNWYKSNNFDKILVTLKDLNHYYKTKWLYADCLFQLRNFNELENFLDDWFEESFINDDLLEYYTFCLRLGQYMEKKNLDSEYIFHIVEKNTEKVKPEQLVRFYLFKAYFVFNPFNAKQSFELLEKASNIAIEIKPSNFNKFYYRNEPKFKTLSVNGEIIFDPNPPLKFDLIIEIFQVASEFHERLSNFESAYQIKKQIIEFCIKNHSPLRAFQHYNNLINLGKKHGKINELIQNITQYKIFLISFADYPNFNEYAKKAVKIILSAYRSINYQDHSKTYLDELEKNSDYKETIDLFKPILYYDRGDYKFSAENFWSLCLKFIAEGDQFQFFINYIFYQRCRILDTSIKEKSIPFTLNEFNEKYPDAIIINYLLKILDNALNNKNYDSLEIIEKKEFSGNYDEILDELIFNESLVTYYYNWINLNKSEEIFKKLSHFIDSKIGRYEIWNWFLPFTQLKIKKLLIDFIAQKEIEYEIELQQLLNLSNNLGLRNYSEFIASIIEKISSKDKMLPKLENAMPHLIRNFNYFLSEKKFI